MNNGRIDSEKTKGTAALLLHLICILAVMAAAVYVRTPSGSFSGMTPEIRDAYMDDDTGVPYLTDMDSYYHVRLVDNYLDRGILGDTVLEDGSVWDFHRYYPEGRSAAYQPGIVWLTAGVHKLFGGSLALLEYRLAAFMSALSALAAYVIAWRAAGRPGGRAGGLAAGLLTACAPVYAVRSCYGRFDTDMFVVLMELLMILFLTEALRANDRRGRILFCTLFVLSTAAYSLCWMPRYVLLFGGLTLAGCFLYYLASLFPPGAPSDAKASARRKNTSGRKSDRKDLRAWITAAVKKPEFLTLLAGGILMAGVLVVTTGPTVVTGLLSAVRFTTSTVTGEGVLPNLYVSIAELNKTPFFPGKLSRFFTGYISGEAQPVATGLGGGIAALLSMAGLVLLALPVFPPCRAKHPERPLERSLLYLCVLGVWYAAGLFLTGYGLRFIEHLSVSAGVLGGIFIGFMMQGALRKGEDGHIVLSVWHGVPVRLILTMLLFAGAVIPTLTGSWRAVSESRPSVTDASAKAMRYIKNNAEDPEAVVSSWWDPGYYYEICADHPALWDGGSTGGTRAILVSRALTSRSLELSRRILLMLSGSGDAAPAFLMEHTDAATAYSAIWKALPMDRDEAAAWLMESCSLTQEEAAEAESLLHPAYKETYFVLTYSMTRQIGWYEYYGNWDFTGRQPLPAATTYAYTPFGTPLFVTDTGQGYLDSVRSKETIWRLFFNAESTSRFTPVFEWHDSLEHVRVWRVEPYEAA